MADEEFGDYGVEIIKSKTPAPIQKAEQAAVIQVVKEEIKEEKAQPAPANMDDADSVDEEEMYSQAFEVKGEQKSLVSEELFKPKFFLKDTFVVFLGNEMLVRECTKPSGWYLSDILGGPRIAEHCSVAMIDPALHKTDAIHAISSGGFMSGYAQSPVYGMVFNQTTENAVEQVVCQITNFMPMMKQGRFMHQSCIVKSASGFWQLLVMGGKFDSGSWTDTVQGLNLLPWFRPGTQTKDDKGVSRPLQTDWEDCASMTVKRSNFACVAMKTMVYVFGGIMGPGRSDSDEAHHPSMAPPIERYMPIKNAWEVINIAQAPRLASFAWCKLDEGKICILGGSDGCLLNSDMFIVDFNEEKVMFQHTDFEFSTGGGHLYYRGGDSGDQTLHHIGGFNSEGINYWLTMGKKEWQESNRCHTHVIDQQSPELTDYPSAFFM